MTDYLGWVANIFLFLAVYLLGKKARVAFLLTAIGECLWCVVSYQIGRADMLCVCVVFGIMAVRNWFLWGKEMV